MFALQETTFLLFSVIYLAHAKMADIVIGAIWWGDFSLFMYSGMPKTWVKEQQEKLKNAKSYIKTD